MPQKTSVPSALPVPRFDLQEFLPAGVARPIRTYKRSAIIFSSSSVPQHDPATRRSMRMFFAKRCDQNHPLPTHSDTGLVVRSQRDIRGHPKLSG
jgi:hypothetical protein